MGERQVFQPLTTKDRISVILYRTGIVLSAVFMSGLAYISLTLVKADPMTSSSATDSLLFGLYIAAGLSVFFIHLYITRLKLFLKYIYYIGLISLAALMYIGGGSPTKAVLSTPASLMLLLPLSGCIGFVAAKEAFCFRLIEGYLLAMLMPLFLLAASAGVLTGSRVAYSLVFIAVLTVFFMLRKVFMPIAYDIGDKSAYR